MAVGQREGQRPVERWGLRCPAATMAKKVPRADDMEWLNFRAATLVSRLSSGGETGPARGGDLL